MNTSKNPSLVDSSSSSTCTRTKTNLDHRWPPRTPTPESLGQHLVLSLVESRPSTESASWCAACYSTILRARSRAPLGAVRAAWREQQASRSQPAALGVSTRRGASTEGMRCVSCPPRGRSHVARLFFQDHTRRRFYWWDAFRDGTVGLGFF